MKHYKIKIREQEEEELNPNFTPKKAENTTPKQSRNVDVTGGYSSHRYVGYDWYTEDEIIDLIKNNSAWTHFGIKNSDGTYDFIHGIKAEKAAKVKCSRFGKNRECQFFVHYLDKIDRIGTSGKIIKDSPDMNGKKVAIIEFIDPTKYSENTPPKLMSDLIQNKSIDIEKVKEIDKNFYNWIIEYVGGENNIVVDYVSKNSATTTNKLNYDINDYNKYIETGRTNKAIDLHNLLGLDIEEPKSTRPRTIEELLTRDLNRYFRESYDMNGLQEMLLHMGFPDIPFRHGYHNRNYGTLRTSPNYNVSPEEIKIDLLNKSLFRTYDDYLLYIMSLLEANNQDLGIEIKAHEPIRQNSPRYANMNLSNWSITRNMKEIPEDLLLKAEDNVKEFIRTNKYSEGGYFTKYKGYSDRGYDLLCASHFFVDGKFINDTQYKWDVNLKLFRFFKIKDKNEVGQRQPIKDFRKSITFNIDQRPDRETNFLSVNKNGDFNDNIYFNNLTRIISNIGDEISNIDFEEFLAKSTDIQLSDITSGKLDERLEKLYKKYQKYI